MTPIEEYCAAHTSMPDDGIYQVFRSVALHTANPNMASDVPPIRVNIRETYSYDF